MDLILPNTTYKKSFLEGLAEFHKEGNELSYDAEKIDTDFDGFVREVHDRIAGIDPTKKVPDTLFWLVDGGEFIGRVSLRHTLNEHLKEYGGHIGYYIRPTKRGMGYGTKALELTLVEAKKLGLKKVLVTCDEDNVGSRKVIEKNGGVLQDIVHTPQNTRDVGLMRWWIDLTETKNA
ncbi:MAG: GNAT family N-acetyltransferase [Candidatus Magasanikbacteria bacterium CG10_big_fil_rev_8_21_14_0_10_43_6]|uniref:GNAT family N-acetyltransferase n=1 Tax=Candidatus Magasanikbacteria bacterium CG10_big_fil_rev_8_21_14_0_10_43_6 TaxID=1974650 RepID=A0A2M6W1Y3_9BACT|nr:MAG: GNAT family N-acetyltransferase [Candidatus Magasanikbacteria bacterium CG10_big_fil_rev_8_21_14_0_10_43_6]